VSIEHGPWTAIRFNKSANPRPPNHKYALQSVNVEPPIEILSGKSLLGVPCATTYCCYPHNRPLTCRDAVRMQPSMVHHKL
jgi:hypothetical protein